jgi:hypothetical protein
MKIDRALIIVKRYFPQVEKVEDGESPLNIEVTANDSNSAAVRSHASCAMAVASKRKTKADGVIISLSVAYVIKGKKAIRYRVPNSVQREIVSFDREAGFAPGDYTLKTFPQSLRLGSHKPKGPHKVAGRKIKFHYTTGIRTDLNSSETDAA